MIPLVQKLLVLCGVLNLGQIAAAATISATADGPITLNAQFSGIEIPPKNRATPNYAPVPIGLLAPLRLTDDGTMILFYNSLNVIYRWRQGVMTELSHPRPAGSRVKYRSANRNGMIVVVLEYTNGQFIDGAYVKQFAYVWTPGSAAPVLLNVPIARSHNWQYPSVERSMEFRCLDDANRIWANIAYTPESPDNPFLPIELARWDSPEAEPTIIGHKGFLDPSVILLGVSSGEGQPFGYYAPPADSPWAPEFVPFAGSLTNSLTFVPYQMNSQGWVLGRRGTAPVLYRAGAEYPMPANNSITAIDDRNNLYDAQRLTVWTTDQQTLVSTPENPQTPFVAVSTRPIVLPDGYSSLHRVVPGDTALEWDWVTKDGLTTLALMVPTQLRPDANRDGVITMGRWPADPDNELAEKNLPWYFWTNDDDDSGETNGSDIPGSGINGRDAVVNGVRDLVDFFPIHLNISQLLRIFPADGAGISYRLSQADSAASFLLTDLTPATAGDYQYDANIARSLGSVPVTPITADGVEIPPVFLSKIPTEDKGIILVEANGATQAPLRLEVWRNNVRMAEISIPLSFAGVEDMFRHVNLAGAVGIKPGTISRGGAPNWPEELSNKQAFLFVHGYNVNQNQARGWQAEFFKRLWWSGSNAQFWGVSWYGYQSQVPVAHFTPDYHQNVINALGTAPQLADFIHSLRSAQPELEAVNIAGHSLGNMVVSSAISDYSAPVDRYFMIDAAVAAEAYDGAQTSEVVQPDDDSAFLPHTEWNRERGGVYPPKLWASNWHKLFPSDDARARLTWRNRFAPVSGTAYYDFHSTGEEVLGYDEPATENTPSLGGVLASELKSYLHITLPGRKGQPNGYQSWLYQEQLKGRTITGKVLGSNIGGWGFNVLHFKKAPGVAGKGPVLTPAVLEPDEASVLLDTVFTDSVLREEPFFRPGGYFRKVGSWVPQSDGSFRLQQEPLRGLYDPARGSAVAARQRDALLAKMIPAMSPAAGRIAVPRLKPQGSPDEHNFDMNSAAIRPLKQGEQTPPWPAARGRDLRWWHSDLREVAYPYVKGLYEQIVGVGRLKEAAP